MSEPIFEYTKHKALWAVIATMEGEDIDKIDVYHRIFGDEHIACACFACEYVVQKLGISRSEFVQGDHCIHCPLEGMNGCMIPSLYQKWRLNHSYDNAMAICNRPVKKGVVWR